MLWRKKNDWPKLHLPKGHWWQILFVYLSSLLVALWCSCCQLVLVTTLEYSFSRWSKGWCQYYQLWLILELCSQFFCSTKNISCHWHVTTYIKKHSEWNKILESPIQGLKSATLFMSENIPYYIDGLLMCHDFLGIGTS